MDEPSGCTCQPGPVGSLGNEPGEAGSCQKITTGWHRRAQVSGFGEAVVGLYKMRPDHRGS